MWRSFPVNQTESEGLRSVIEKRAVNNLRAGVRQDHTEHYLRWLGESSYLAYHHGDSSHSKTEVIRLQQLRINSLLLHYLPARNYPLAHVHNSFLKIKILKLHRSASRFNELATDEGGSPWPINTI